MICKNCGEENGSGVRYCLYCGAPMSGNIPAGLTSEMNPGTAYEENLYAKEASVPVRGNENASDAIKKVAGSGLFFFATLFFTASIVLAVLSSLQDFSNFIAMATAYLNQMNETIISTTGYDVSEFYMILDTIKDSVVPSTIITYAVPVIYALCLWGIFISGKSKSSHTAGLTIIKIFEIIRFIFVIIWNLIIIGLLGLLGYVFYSDQQTYGDAYIYFLIACGVTLVLFIFVAVYYAKKIGCLTAAKMAMNGDPSGKFSAYVAFILLASAIITILVEVIAGIMLGSVFGISSSALSGLATFLFALCIGKARHAVQGE